MAEQTVLLCDLCREPHFAVARLDVCDKHMKVLQARKRRSAGVEHAEPGRKRQKARSQAERGLMMERIKTMLEHKEMRPKEIAERLHCKPWHIYDILPSLVKAKEIIKEGHGRGVKYRRK